MTSFYRVSTLKDELTLGTFQCASYFDAVSKLEEVVAASSSACLIHLEMVAVYPHCVKRAIIETHAGQLS